MELLSPRVAIMLGGGLFLGDVIFLISVIWALNFFGDLKLFAWWCEETLGDGDLSQAAKTIYVTHFSICKYIFISELIMCGIQGLWLSHILRWSLSHQLKHVWKTNDITTSGQLKIQTIVREAFKKIILQKKLSNLGKSPNLPDPPPPMPTLDSLQVIFYCLCGL